MQDGLTLIVNFEAKAGRADDLKQALTALAATSSADEGCLRYDLYSVQDDENYVLIELWSTSEAWERHMQAAHVFDFEKATKDMIERSSLQRLEPLS